MRVVVVTGTRPHHKNLCVRLAKNHDVVAIVHPVTSKTVGRKQRLANRRRAYGSLHVALAAAANGPAWLTGWSAGDEVDRVARSHFTAEERLFEQLPESLVHAAVDVANEGPALLTKLQPDVVAVLGGPIYPKQFIDAAPLLLNYHSGISPLYNGTASAQFAFANGHPQLCGGTLMTMSTVVDGGLILGHFLPAIAPGDTPADLFVKTVAGTADAYDRLLAHLGGGGSYQAIPQPPPLFYYRAVDWTIHHTRSVRRNLRRDIASDFVRVEHLVEYWRSSDNLTARHLFEATMADLLWGRSV